MSNARTRFAVLTVLLLLACADDPVDPLATARMEIVAGNQQDGAAGGALPQPVSVRLVSQAGSPLPGITIEWSVLEGGGRVDAATTITNDAGIATNTWVLGDNPGVQALLARARTASIRIEATANVIFTDVTAGFRHSCALAAIGSAYCWGSNDRGQLGQGNASATAPPAPASGNLHFKTISAGWFHTCALTQDGSAYCWGDNSVGQLGSAGPTSAVPRRVASAESFAAISAGYQHTCAITTGGAAWCWGVDDFGVLGAGRTTPACFSAFVQRCSATPQRVTTSLTFKRIAAGEFHTCAIALDGAGYCWGWNSNGQTGNLAAGDAIQDVPTRVVSNRFYADLAAGARHVCAITVSEKPECWGRNGAGEIGIPPFTSLGAPEPLITPLRLRAITAGDMHSCAVAVDDRAYCWGAVLGDGTSATSPAPVAVTVSGAVRDIAAGGDHACLIADGNLWCWGSNAHGQLGVAGTARSHAPVRVELGQ